MCSCIAHLCVNRSDEEIQEMIDEADRDSDGKINFEEFLRVMKKRYIFINVHLHIYI